MLPSDDGGYLANPDHDHSASQPQHPAHAHVIPWTERADVLTAACIEAQPQSQPPAATATATATARGKARLTHLLNPFETSDPHFNFTFRSIGAALKHAAKHGVEVEVLGVTFSDESVVLPPEAEGLVTLLPVLNPTRTAGKYLQSRGLPFGTEEKPLRTPLVADVFQAGYERATAPTLVWTNFDLIVAPDFYTSIITQLDGTVFVDSTTSTAGAADPDLPDAQPLPAVPPPPPPPPPPGFKAKPGFSVLRLDVMIDKAKVPSLADWSVADVYNVADTRAQGGHDCMVLPRRWVPCVQMHDMVFGVGGWGFAVFMEFIRLSELDQSVGRFSILKPGHHFAKEGISRHIGSQVANPARWWSNPVPWLGPKRKNQLGFNMRLKAEVDLKLSITKDAQSVCRRGYSAWGKTIQRDVCSARAPETTDAGVERSALSTCPKKRGAQQPFAVATLPPGLADVSSAVSALTGLKVGSVHDAELQEDEYGGRVAMLIHTTDLLVRARAADPIAELETAAAGGRDEEETIDSINNAAGGGDGGDGNAPTGTSATVWPPLDSKSMFFRGTSRGQTMWDGVVVVVDPDPAQSVVDWAVSTNRITVKADGTIAEDAATVHHALQPVLAYYNKFYAYWSGQAKIGPAFVQVVAIMGLSSNLAATAATSEQPQPHAPGHPTWSHRVEVMRLMEVIQHAKLGWGGRWCKGAPKSLVCCPPAKLPTLAPEGGNKVQIRLSAELRTWIEAQTLDAAKEMHAVWRMQVEALGADLPDPTECCSV